MALLESEHLRAVFAAGRITEPELQPDPPDPAEEIDFTDQDVDRDDEGDEASLPASFSEPHTLSQLDAAAHNEIRSYFRLLYES